MISIVHCAHILSRVSHNNCQECRADVERSFLRPKWEGYQFTREYLENVRVRLDAIKKGEDSTAARQWRRNFLKALHRRITLKGAAETGRKQCDSYLQRLGQFPRHTEADYLRRFARWGASTLFS